MEVDLGEEFTDHCIKSTPTPDFLLKLTHFDISYLSFKVGPFGSIFGNMPSDSRIPEFLVWFHQKVSPKSSFDNNKFIESGFSAALNGRKIIILTFTCGM